jgi:hypothetical protein
MNEMQRLKSIHLLLDESEEIVLMKALHLLAVSRYAMPDSLEKRLENAAQVSLLIKLHYQLYEKKERTNE